MSSSEKDSYDTAPEANLPTIADDLVVTKYKMAAEIVNRKTHTLLVNIYLMRDRKIDFRNKSLMVENR